MYNDVNKLNMLWPNKYHFNQFYSKGGYGYIYKGVDVNSNQPIVLKLITINENFNSIEHVIDSLINIKSEYIISYLDIKIDNNNLYIVQEYYDSITLSEFLSSNSYLPVDVAVNIIIQITQALKNLHENNIIHNDLKLDNILINKQFKIKLIDFGLSTIIDNPINENENIRISVPFTNPDKIIDKNNSIQNDLFSLGIIFYYFLMNEFPFNDTTDEYYLNYRTNNVDFVSLFRPDVPIKIDHIIFKLTCGCINQNQYHYENYDDLLNDLVNWNNEPTRLIYNDIFVFNKLNIYKKKTKWLYILIYLLIFIFLIAILITIITIYG